MKRRVWIALAALCLLAGSGWMIDQFYAEILSGPIHIAAHEGVLAILFGVASLRHRKHPLTPRVCLELILAGVVLFALPTILSAGAGGQVASLTVILISTSIPVLVVFLSAQTSGDNDDNPMRLLLPALCGLGGAALLLPFTWPVSIAGKAWLIAIVLAAILSAAAAIRLRMLLRRTSLLRALAILCGSAAIVSALCYRIGFSMPLEWTHTQLLVEVLRCLLLEAPTVYLLVYLFRELNPIAISARYLLIPLVTIVESYLIERPHAEWTVFAGVLLMAGSSFVLIRTSPPPDIPL